MKPLEFNENFTKIYLKGCIIIKDAARYNLKSVQREISKVGKHRVEHEHEEELELFEEDVQDFRGDIARHDLPQLWVEHLDEQVLDERLRYAAQDVPLEVGHHAVKDLVHQPVLRHSPPARIGKISKN